MSRKRNFAKSALLIFAFELRDITYLQGNKFQSLKVVLQMVMAPLFEVVGILMIQFIRHNEFEADRFAVEINRGDFLESGLAKLYKVSIEFPYELYW